MVIQAPFVWKRSTRVPNFAFVSLQLHKRATFATWYLILWKLSLCAFIRSMKQGEHVFVYYKCAQCHEIVMWNSYRAMKAQIQTSKRLSGLRTWVQAAFADGMVMAVHSATNLNRLNSVVSNLRIRLHAQRATALMLYQRTSDSSWNSGCVVRLYCRLNAFMNVTADGIVTYDACSNASMTQQLLRIPRVRDLRKVAHDGTKRQLQCGQLQFAVGGFFFGVEKKPVK